MEKKVIAVCGQLMNPSIAEFGLQQLAMNRQIADHWMMHPWQAMQILNTVEIEKVARPGLPGWYFLELPVVEDKNFPQDQIELRDKDKNVLVEFRNVGSLNVDRERR